MSAVALLLAAGEARRMGRPKPLLPWGDTTLIEYQVRQLSETSIDRIIVVLGHAWDQIESLAVDKRVEVLVNDRYREGRASSVRAGAAAVLDEDDPILILAVDQPRPAPVVSRLLEAHRAGGGVITIPTFEGDRGHPVVFSGVLLPEMRQVADESQGLRALTRAHASEVREAPLDDPIVLLDINTPEEYERAHTLYFGRPPR